MSWYHFMGRGPKDQPLGQRRESRRHKFVPSVEGLEDRRCPTGIGIFAGNSWALRLTADSGPPNAGAFSYGFNGVFPLAGRWDGSIPSGKDGIGIFAPASATWVLRDSATAGAPDYSFQFGPVGGIPVVGDWSGSGKDGIGVYANGVFYLRNDITNPTARAPDEIIALGYPGAIPVAGDWASRGDSIGIYDSGHWVLQPAITDTNPADQIHFDFGYSGAAPVVGYWNGFEGIGIYVPSQGGLWALHYYVPSGPANLSVDLTFHYGYAGTAPVVGDWNVPVGDGIGIFTGTTFGLRETATAGPADITASFGDPGDVPVAGNFGVPNPDGSVTAHKGFGIYDNGAWVLHFFDGTPDDSFQFGEGGIPVVGDWFGNGYDGIGVYFAAQNGLWAVRETASGGSASTFNYGSAGTIPVVGDWTGTGHDGIGIYFPTTATWALRNNASGGAPDYTFTFGPLGAVPVVGNWTSRLSTITSKPVDGIGIYVNGTWILRDDVTDLTPRAPDFVVSFGYPGALPVTGDFGDFPNVS
jgi:hypothetical protein